MSAHTMARLGSVLGLLVGGAAAAQEATLPIEFRQALSERAGAAAEVCGAVPQRADRTEGIACAERALAQRRAFWFAKQDQGADSALWSGLAVAADGSAYLITYDSDVYGRSRMPLIQPRLEVWRCRNPDLQGYGGHSFGCTDPTRISPPPANQPAADGA